MRSHSPPRRLEHPVFCNYTDSVLDASVVNQLMTRRGCFAGHVDVSFYGRVWYEDEWWYEEVWRSGELVATFSCHGDLAAMIEDVNHEYGSG